MAVEIAGRRRLFDRVDAGLQAGERIRAVGVGLLRAHDVLRAVQQRDRHAREQRVAANILTAVIGVDVDYAANAGREQFGEIVVRAIHALAQRDRAHQIGRGEGSADRADRVLAVKIAGRRRLLQRIGAGHQARKAVGPLGIGGGRVDDVAVGIQQRDRHAREQWVAGVVLTAAIGIDVDHAADAGGLGIAKVVGNADIAALQDDTGERGGIGRHRAVRLAGDTVGRVADGAGAGPYAEVARRHGLDNLVAARQQIAKRVVSGSVGSGRLAGGREAGSGRVKLIQGNLGVGDAWIAGILLVVQIEVLIDGARERDRQGGLRNGPAHAGREHIFRRGARRHVTFRRQAEVQSGHFRVEGGDYGAGLRRTLVMRRGGKDGRDLRAGNLVAIDHAVDRAVRLLVVHADAQYQLAAGLEVGEVNSH